MPYLLLSTAIVVLDQLVKHWITRVLVTPGGGRLPLLPKVLGLTLVHNPGASWGILAGKTDLLLLITGVVCLGLMALLLLERPADRLQRLSLCCILGGAVGNALDRLLLGYVVDMFETLFVEFPIFNVADCFITVGAALLCVGVLREERKAKRLQAAEATKHES